MFHDAELHDTARSLEHRRAMLAESISGLTNARPLIALTVGQTLVANHGPETAARLAHQIAAEVERASEHEIRAAWAGDYEGQEDAEDGSPLVVWLLIFAAFVVLVMFAVLAHAIAAEAIEQRNLYRALGDAAPLSR